MTQEQIEQKLESLGQAGVYMRLCIEHATDEQMAKISSVNAFVEFVSAQQNLSQKGRENVLKSLESAQIDDTNFAQYAKLLNDAHALKNPESKEPDSKTPEKAPEVETPAPESKEENKVPEKESAPEVENKVEPEPPAPEIKEENKTPEVAQPETNKTPETQTETDSKTPEKAPEKEPEIAPETPEKEPEKPDSKEPETAPDTPTKEQTQAQIQTKYDDILKEVETQVRANDSVLLNTHLSLKGMEFLLLFSREVYVNYELSLQEIQSQSDKIADKNEQLKAHIAQFLEKVDAQIELFENHSNQSAQMLENIKAQVKIASQIEENTNLNAKSVSDNLRACVKVLEDVQREQNEFNATKLLIQEELEKLKALEAQKDYFVEYADKFNALLANFTKLSTESIAQFKQLAQTLSDNLQALKTSLSAELSEHKETLSDELEAQKQEALEDLRDFQNFLEQTRSELEANFASKQEQINQTHKKIEAFLLYFEAIKAEFESIKSAYLKEIEDTKNKSISAIDTHTAQKRQELSDDKDAYSKDLDTQKNNLSTQLSHEKDAHKTELEDLKSTLSTQLDTQTQTHLKTLETQKDAHLETMRVSKDAHLNEMTMNKDSFLEAIHNSVPAQVADLTQIVNNIRIAQQTYGTNFKSQTFGASGTFELKKDVEFYFVFLRGGTGATNSWSGGGASSFGSFLSANGGAGNANGYGQRGDCKSAVLQLKENVPITIASGGICIISWSEGLPLPTQDDKDKAPALPTEKLPAETEEQNSGASAKNTAGAAKKA